MKSIDPGVILCKNISGLFLYLKYVGAQRLCRDKKQERLRWKEKTKGKLANWENEGFARQSRRDCFRT